MPLGGALILGGASLAGGLISGNAAEKGAEAQAAAMRYAADLQHQQYEQDVSLSAPWRTAGSGAMSSLQDYLGLNGADAQSKAFASFQNSPYFTQMESNADEALKNSYASKGVNGGNLLQALFNNNAGMWNQDYQTFLGNLSGVSQQGLAATNALSGAGTALAQSQGNLISGAGAAMGAGILGQGNALGNSLNNLAVFSMLGGNNSLSSQLGNGLSNLAISPNAFAA